LNDADDNVDEGNVAKPTHLLTGQMRGQPSQPARNPETLEKVEVQPTEGKNVVTPSAPKVDKSKAKAPGPVKMTEEE
jgi:hypothetical protein